MREDTENERESADTKEHTMWETTMSISLVKEGRKNIYTKKDICGRSPAFDSLRGLVVGVGGESFGDIVVQSRRPHFPHLFFPRGSAHRKKKIKKKNRLAALHGMGDGKEWGKE